MKRHELAILLGVAFLLAIGVVRLAVPDRSRLRALSVEAIQIPSEPIAHGQSIERSIDWTPPADVYIVGWGPRVHARGSSATLMLYLKSRKTMLFDYQEDGRSSRNEYTAPGTGFFVAKGEAVTIRYRMNNGGLDSQTLGGVGLIYFVPAAGH